MNSNLFRMRNLIVVILFIIIVVGSFLLFTDNSKTSQTRPSPKPEHKLSYSGSIGYFKVEPGIVSFKQNFQKVDYLSLFWYQINRNGSVSRRDEVKEMVETDMLSFAQQNNKKVLVGIENDEDAERVDLLLDDQDVRKKHTIEVLALVNEKGYDGVIIDYENLRQDQTEGFTEYMKEFSAALSSEGKIVSISVNTETSGRIFHGIDVAEISKMVDRLELNAYEEFGDETGPGPIASTSWVNTIIENVIDQGVDPNKIILGTAHSGHDWITSPDEEFSKDTTTKEVLNLSSKTNANLKWDQNTQSSFFEYNDQRGNNHVVWLEDARGFKAKIDLAKSYELAGIFIWYLGGEDPQIWQVL